MLVSKRMTVQSKRHRFRCLSLKRESFLLLYFFSLYKHIDCFCHTRIQQHHQQQQQRYRINNNRKEISFREVRCRNQFPCIATVLAVSNDNYSAGDDDDDEYIDTDSLGDWRNFRRNLSKTIETDGGNDLINNFDYRDEVSVKKNEETLKKQDEQLAKEYATNAWAHVTSSPEVGGIVVRLPLEVELYRNYNHSIMGSRLRAMLEEDSRGEGMPIEEFAMEHWYHRSKDFIEEEMRHIANLADDNDQVDARTLKEDHDELIHLYLQNQDSWQEVSLVIKQNYNSNGNSQYAKTVVLNRPMGWKLTENLGKLVFLGADNLKISKKANENFRQFMKAFQNECAVYVGGPHDQGEGSIMIHGIHDLPDAVEISPGIYRGGVDAAVEGVLSGKYNPMQFRFFIGCHNYNESRLEVEVRLGKLQPISCQRSLVLKQCRSLPTPLWHEVLELCGDELANLSVLEMLKHESLKFQVVDGPEIPDIEDNTYDIEIIDDDDEECF